MIPGITWPALVPVAWPTPALDLGTSDPINALMGQDLGDLIYILVAEPYDPGLLKTMIALPGPVATQAVAAAPSRTYRGGAADVMVASDSYLTRLADVPSLRPVRGDLSRAYAISAAMGGADDRLGAPTVNLGDITIQNGAGTHDDLVNMAWGGRKVEIKAGRRDWSYAQFSTILRGEVSGLSWDGSAINLALATRLAVLETPLARSYYAGTGGYEGPAELADKPRPLVFGRQRGVPMKRLDTALELYQVAEQLSAILGLWDLASPVTDAGIDHDDYAALAAAIVAPGTFQTCLALGLIRAGSPLVLPLADVEGPVDAGLTAPAIISHIVQRRLGPGLGLSPGEVDSASLAAVELACPGWITGLTVDGEMRAAEAVALLAADVGGAAVPTRQGKLALKLYRVPQGAGTTLTAAQIDDAGLRSVARLRAVRRLTVGCRPQIRPLADSEMPDTVDAAARLAFGSAWQTASAEAPTGDRDAVDWRHDTRLDDLDHAKALRDELLAFLSVATHRYELPLRGLPFPHWIGDVRRIVYPRFGLDDGVDFLVAGMAETSDGATSLELWGPAPAVAQTSLVPAFSWWPDDASLAIDFTTGRAMLLDQVTTIPALTTYSLPGGNLTAFDSERKLITAPAATLPVEYNPAGGMQGAPFWLTRRNFLLYSDMQSTTGLLAGNTVVTANAAPGLDGANSAAAVIENTATSNHGPAYPFACVSGTIYCWSVVVKRRATGSPRNLRMIPQATAVLAQVTFDLDALTSTLVSGTIVGKGIIPLGGGKYRCWVAATATATGTGYAEHRLLDGTTASYTGDGVSGLDMESWVVEAGAFPTAIIRTNGVAITRNTVSLRRTLGAEFNPIEWTVFAEALPSHVATTSTNYLLVGVENSAAVSAQNALMRINGGGAPLAYISRGSTATDIITGGSVAAGAVVRMALRVKANDMAFACNGALVGKDTNTGGLVPSGLNRMIFGTDSQPLNGHLRRTILFPRGLSDAEIQALTAL